MIPDAPFRPGHLGLLLVVLTLAACRPGDDAIYRFTDVEIRPLEESLQRIERWLADRHVPLAESLRPGATREEIDAAAEALGVELPEEVVRLYGWHDGQEGAEAELIPGYRFMPLTDAVEDTLVTRDAIWKTVPGFGRSLWRKSYVRWLSHGSGDAFVVLAEGGQTGVVLDFDHEAGPRLAYRSLAATMQELADHFEAGAHTVSDQGELLFDKARAVEVERRYHRPDGPSSALPRAVQGTRREAPDGTWSQTFELVNGRSEVRLFDREGRLVNRFFGVTEDPTVCDDRHRPVRRVTSSYSKKVTTWIWEGDVARIRIEITAPGLPPPREWTELVRARRHEDGSWSVLESRKIRR